MALLFTARDGVYVYSGHSATHKQGKLPEGVALNSISETSHDYELDPDHTKAVIEIYDPDRDSDYSKYPAFWINKVDVNAGVPEPIPSTEPYPVPIPTPGEVTELEAAAGLAVFLKWLKEL